MDKTWTVYRYTFPNGKVYIGCTSRPLSVRCKPSQYLSYMRVSEAFKEYPNGWKLETLSTWNTAREGFNAEKSAIKAHDSMNPEKGYNTTAGGYGGQSGMKHTDEWKAENSRRTKGHIPSEETRAKQRAALIGRKRLDLAGERNGFAGKKHTAKTLAKLSEVGKTKTFTDEIRRRMSEGHKGKKKYCPVICVETGKRYDTAKQAALDTGINVSCIRSVAHGNGYTAGGYHWQLAI